MRRWVFFVLLQLLIGSVTAKDVLTDRYNITCLDLAAGLPHNNVNQIFADSQGFVWISTYGGGAVRYDGYSFTMPVLNRLTRMSSNSCKGFAEDRHRRLWVAFDEGTVVVDLRTMDCVTPGFSGKRKEERGKTNEESSIGNRLMQNAVKVYCDSRGALWQVTRDSIFRYSFDEAGSVKHISRCGYHGNTPDITICDIEQNGTVWINIENGLYRLAENGEQLVRKDVAQVMTQLQGHYVTDLLKRGNVVWIATNLGLYAYNQYDSTLSVYRHTNDEHSLSHDYASSLAVMPDGRLLVGTLRGMNILDEQSGSFEHWNTATNEKPMPSDFVHCLMIRDGQIWIGTETAGVVKLSPQPLMLRNYIHEAGNGRSLSPNPVNAMYVEPNGTLWVGTVEGGLNRLDVRRKMDDVRGKMEDVRGFEHWPLTDIGLKHNTVSVLEPDAHGRLWIGTWGGGLNWIEVRGERKEERGGKRSEVHHVAMPADMAIQTDYIGALAYDRINDALWIGSNDGIFYYDLQTGKLEDPFKGNRDIRGCVGSHVDRSGLLWMGCLTGVCIIDLHSRASGHGDFKYRRLRNKLDQPESAVIDKICCFCETKDGDLWLGSNGYGLYRRMLDDDGKETFEVLTTDQGLANNAVKGIVEDVQGRLWITTDNGLSVYDTRTRTFNNYSEHDGLLCQRFYWNSAVKGPDGAIYLGSAAGLTEVRGENTDAKYPVHLTFTRLMVDNQEITAANGDYLDADLSQATHIRLHESVKSFSIDFSTLTYAGETQGHYRYRLLGFEDEWIPLKPGEHSVRYTSPKSGDYTFEVEYTTGADAETHVISIEIEVVSYFWKSWWFVLLVLLLLAGVAIGIYHRRMETMRRQEAEKLLMPIRRVLDESEDPEQLQQRIQNILDNHERLRISYRRTVEADKEEAMRTNKPFMERATEIMEQNYMNSEFGITEFAEAIGMSRSLVSKRLNEETGQSTGQFIRNYRLSIAKKLLLENVANRNITEIAYKVGFNDPKYFTRCFTRQYGNSPSTYTEEDG
jgi:ligand-binding sensor domain-containing protein/AraC-like DNA-binding protein